MLDFTLFWVFNPTDYYSSMKDKYPTLYVRSSFCLIRFELTDTNYSLGLAIREALTMTAKCAHYVAIYGPPYLF